MYEVGDRVESFRLLRECGRGSCGTVFLAENVVTGRRHALKVIPAGGGFSERELRGVMNYMEFCPRSDLMQITHAGRVDGGFYYVMDAADDLNGGNGEYLPDTLENRLKRDGRLSPSAALEMAEQVEKRLGFLHAHGVLHRDIKPANILYIRGEAVPGDIGLLAEDARATLAGTPGFISPEAAGGVRPFAPEDDFYALGKTLYCALTGYSPEKYPAFPPDLPLGECKAAIGLYNRWCAGQGARRRRAASPGNRRRAVVLAGVLAAVTVAVAVPVLRYVSGAPRMTATAALAEAERLTSADASPEEFARIRPLVEAERKRLFLERAERTTAAFNRPVTKDELERAARDPENHSANTEDFVRIRRSDAAGEAFDREHVDDPVIGYFETSRQVEAELNTLRHLATLPQLADADMSAQLNDFAASLAKLKELEKQLIRRFEVSRP
jgi:serine/threonine protein kinase